jgi:hypothetical protein
MAQTRRDLVLAYLQRHAGQWVAGMELMNAEVGGIRAGARVFELRRLGYTIERRSSRRSAVDEYRLVVDGDAGPPTTAPETRKPLRVASAIQSVKVPRTGAHAACAEHVRVTGVRGRLCVPRGADREQTIAEALALNGIPNADVRHDHWMAPERVTP